LIYSKLVLLLFQNYVLNFEHAYQDSRNSWKDFYQEKLFQHFQRSFKIYLDFDSLQIFGNF